MTEIRAVTDESGAIHTLARRLGEGGQGEVWLAQGGQRVIKLFSRGRDREALRRQIAYVKRLDLRDLHVARPLALLRPPAVGYVAEFLSEMVPIRELLAPPKGEAVAPWYIAIGGVRRRLRLLAHAGEALAALHARGLIYGDVSHNNVFVSAPAEAAEAWLIDLDNLRHDSDPQTAVYTPGYGAPEVVDGSCGPSSLSDAWAFAVLIFHVLTLIHPFCGDLVTDGKPELEEEAFAGRLPWVDHSADEWNRSSQGLPRTAVLGRRLAELARTTFEAGARDRAARPTVGAWVERLHRAADQTIRCTACRMTCFASARACPFCDAPRAPVIMVQIHRWEPGRGMVAAMGVVERLSLGLDLLPLTRRHTQAESGIGARAVEVTLEAQQRGVLVQTHGAPAWVTPPGKIDAASARPVDARRVLPVSGAPEQSWIIHFGPVDSPHRVAIVFEHGEAG